MLQSLQTWLTRYRSPLYALLSGAFVLWAYFRVTDFAATAQPATIWMRIFSYQDFDTWGEIWTYLRDLRTGIPPVLSFLELASYKLFGGFNWLVKSVYRYSIILMLLLPLLLTAGRWRHLLLTLGMAIILLASILYIHPGNPQLYDVLLPTFLLLFLVCLRGSLRPGWPRRLSLALTGLSGFFLSMAELARPFMIAVVPLLLLFAAYHYWQAGLRRRFLLFLLPVFLFSGLWHLKLLVFNDGQVVWSNHGGTNLFRAWIPLVDQDVMNPQLQPEAPPLNDFGWALDNINTQVHAENSRVRSQAVITGIKAQPAAALDLLWQKTLIFTQPRTDMYAHNPQQPVLVWYRLLVRGLFIILGLMLPVALVRGLRRWRYFFTWELAGLFLAFFLSFMPIIGEEGEEARFLVAVLPFLLWVGLIASDWLAEGGTQLRARLKRG